MYFLFLLAYLAWFVATNIVINKNKKQLILGNYFWVTQIQIVIQIVFFFLFIYINSGYFNLTLVGLFFAFNETGVILSAILIGIVGSIDTKWAAHGYWAGGEFGLKNKILMLLIMGLAFVMAILYPIFIYRIPEGQLLIDTFKYTLILYISGYLIVLPVLIGALRSENLDEDTRKRYFISQLSAIITLALYLSIAFWAFGFSQQGVGVNLAGIPLLLSPVLVITLISYFFLLVILPFLIGALRGKRWQVMLLENQNGYLSKTFEIIDIPDNSQYVAELKELNNEIAVELQNLSEKDKMIYYGNQIDRKQFANEVVAIVPAYQLARNMDPRFNYVDWLHKHSERVDHIITDLASSASDAEMVKKAQQWKVSLRTIRTDLEKKIKSTKERKAPVMITIGNTLLMLILSATLSEFGKWIFENVANTKK